MSLSIFRVTVGLGTGSRDMTGLVCVWKLKREKRFNMKIKVVVQIVFVKVQFSTVKLFNSGILMPNFKFI